MKKIELEPSKTPPFEEIADLIAALMRRRGWRNTSDDGLIAFH
jgi:hypothetical protein